jgi:sporulation protein YlmC with PRC-barrel domain
MYINLHLLIKLPVFTESGEKIGHVKDLEIDIETHGIRHYIVEHGLIGKDHFWVSPVQVVSISSEKIVVKDAIVTDAGFKEAKSRTNMVAVGDNPS